MTADQKQLTPSALVALLNQGRNQSEIARMYGVTRQHVSWVKRTYLRHLGKAPTRTPNRQEPTR